jgi:hypothetical protein
MSSNNNQGTTVFVLGLLSLVLCQLLGPVAIMMGNSYIRECALEGVEPEGLGVAGRIMGMIGTVLFVLQLLFFGAYLGCFCLAILGGAAG